jgi:ribonuclease P protein component
MLDQAHRLTTGKLFGVAVRRGRRVGSRTLVLHLAFADEGDASPARVGFVVGKAVGSAVIRNKVKRRLRHIVRDRLDRIPAGAVLVVRALPTAASAASAELAADFDRALRRLVGANERR